MVHKYGSPPQRGAMQSRPQTPLQHGGGSGNETRCYAAVDVHCRFPGLSRGVVAVLLYHDGRRSIVSSLRSLVQVRICVAQFDIFLHSYTLLLQLCIFMHSCVCIRQEMSLRMPESLTFEVCTGGTFQLVQNFTQLFPVNCRPEKVCPGRWALAVLRLVS